MQSKSYKTPKNKPTALNEPAVAYVRTGGFMTIEEAQVGEQKKKRLKPDNELHRAITGDELLERVYVSLDKFFVDK